ncbi:hypothetical protein CERZMDRAFT_42945 [Cercospora zeae-maydis SCOH1-5]|uniref:Uncharacterized protein n=1 Tax=Cercospora zeae-maydis SCOH1-5 TaxID=717836 RepID=A0A6A6FDJ0_9PEZI|nr:hypothetical protein CERZMDRAFT_42945 [Cercospora zeae-maydis SCOH1-5]
MLDIGTKDGVDPRCLVTTSILSNYIDHCRPPTKKRPFTTIWGQTFSHTLDLLLPAPAANTLHDALNIISATELTYAKVNMKLSDLLSGDFFDSCIKGPGSNVLMLSEGRAGIDNTFSLKNGILRLEVDKATFERSGLQGQAIPTQGRKHTKARYVIEIDLRQPSMVHGKRGFERLVWLSKNVLNQTVSWLIADPEAYRALIPKWPTELTDENYADAADLLEWISLATVPCPRLELGDNVDSYLCRYQPPTGFGESESRDLVRLRWRGLVDPSFAQKILMSALKVVGHQWFAMTATSFEAEEYTILVHQDKCVTWQYQG